MNKSEKKWQSMESEEPSSITVVRCPFSRHELNVLDSETGKLAMTALQASLKTQKYANRKKTISAPVR